MDNKFNNKYRIPSNRLYGYDYGGIGCYYITICTKNRKHYFGKIEKGKMQLSEIGEVAQSEWLKTAELRPDMNLSLDEFVVMPNHFHCIICIGENQYNTQNGMNTMFYENKFGKQSKNLASVIRGFKSAITMYARKNNIDFAWQERFYDRIIRDSNEFERERTYIINNPKNWDNDKLR
ncbi:transposase [Fluviicola sp.]|jgi:REP element-mobilizing transposase RayT|uniref:transposase n=1 Tax=Fluviicola sp. TaxID=1917219 RepID=UPI0028191DBA|nr:transposase [Fluviicola sp.]MDR0801564.1 transposase [Fluviicola sp.]